MELGDLPTFCGDPELCLSFATRRAPCISISVTVTFGQLEDMSADYKAYFSEPMGYIHLALFFLCAYVIGRLGLGLGLVSDKFQRRLVAKRRIPAFGSHLFGFNRGPYLVKVRKGVPFPFRVENT